MTAVAEQVQSPRAGRKSGFRADVQGLRVGQVVIAPFGGGDRHNSRPVTPS